MSPRVARRLRKVAPTSTKHAVFMTTTTNVAQDGRVSTLAVPDNKTLEFSTEKEGRLDKGFGNSDGHIHVVHAQQNGTGEGHVGSIPAFYHHDGRVCADTDESMHGNVDEDMYTTARDGGVYANGNQNDHNDSVGSDRAAKMQRYDDEKFDHNGSVEGDQNYFGMSENMHHTNGDYIDADAVAGQHTRSNQDAIHDKSIHTRANQALDHECTLTDSEHDQYVARQSRSAPHANFRTRGEAPPIINVYTSPPRGPLQDVTAISPKSEGKTPRSAGSPVHKPLFLASKGACVCVCVCVCAFVCVSLFVFL
jgi:hypothetical protein